MKKSPKKQNQEPYFSPPFSPPFSHPQPPTLALYSLRSRPEKVHIGMEEGSVVVRRRSVFDGSVFLSSLIRVYIVL